MSEQVEYMTFDAFCKYLVDDLEKEVSPYMKKGVDPFDVLERMRWEMDSNQQGTRMRTTMIAQMLKTEASMPKGMSLTRKTGGGSPTASVKREYGLKKGLSKARTAEVFANLHDTVVQMLRNRIELYELYEFSDHHAWDEEADDGTYTYTWGE